MTLCCHKRAEIFLLFGLQAWFTQKSPPCHMFFWVKVPSYLTCVSFIVSEVISSVTKNYNQRSQRKRSQYELKKFSSHSSHAHHIHFIALNVIICLFLFLQRNLEKRHVSLNVTEIPKTPRAEQYNFPQPCKVNYADVPDAARDAAALWISVTVVGCITEGAGSGFVALVLFIAISAFVIVCT